MNFCSFLCILSLARLLICAELEHERFLPSQVFLVCLHDMRKVGNEEDTGQTLRLIEVVFEFMQNFAMFLLGLLVEETHKMTISVFQTAAFKKWHNKLFLLSFC